MELHPGVVAGAVIVGNPIDYPRSIANIHARCEVRYQQRAQLGPLGDVKQLHARMFPNGVKPPYQFTTADAAATMKHATDCGLNLPQFPSLGATALYATLLASPQYDLATSISLEPLEGLHANERLLYSEYGAQFVKAAPKLFGIYGDEDGLESEADLQRISNLISPAHFKLIQGASHNVFVDQQPQFLDALTADLDAM